MSFILFNDDCLERMPRLEENSIDSIVTDPPYGLSFMGKSWDHGVPGVDFWTEAIRIAKPGAHLLAFGGTRTYHRLACAIEDAGWEIRDCVMWVYGSGFPKSHDVSKAIDREAGADRTEVVGSKLGRPGMATDAARQWQGWGTALKPAWEPIIVARKPLVGTVAENVLAHGTGAINVDGCRVDAEPELAKNWQRNQSQSAKEGRNAMNGGLDTIDLRGYTPAGRWPANLIHDGSEEVVGLMPNNGNGNGKLIITARQRKASWRRLEGREDLPSSDGLAIDNYGDSGSAARFFYCAKSSKRDRDEGLDGFEARNNMRVNDQRESEEAKHATKRANHHPTVKPTDLMRYLCRLVTPPGGVILDPFMGSGSTGKAAMLERFQFIGIEMNPEYIEIAKARIEYAAKQADVTSGNRDEHQRGLFDGIDDADGGVPDPVN